MLLYLLKYWTRVTIIFFIIIFNKSFSQVNIACIGNSITWGFLLTDRSTESFPAQLGQKLGGGYTVTNYGFGGKILLYGFPSTYAVGTNPQYTASLNTYHDIIVICLGTNDTLPDYHDAIENFVNDYKTLINSYISTYSAFFPTKDPPQFIVCIPPPIFATYDGHSNTYLVNDIIPRIKTVISQTPGSKKVDFYSTLKNYPEMFIDGIHPTVEGAEKMADKVKQAVYEIVFPAPAKPANFVANANINQVDLSWDANTETDLNRYYLYKGTVDNSYKDLLAVISKDLTAYTDTNVENHTTYYYQIAAVNNANVISPRSNQVSATPGGPADTTAPATPENFLGISLNGYVHLTWDLNFEDDLASYDIFKGIEDGGWKDLLVNVSKDQNIFDDTDIEPNTQYFYQISAKDNAGNSSDRSDQISTMTLFVQMENTSSDILLINNNPNPFNTTTNINFYLPRESNVEIVIYDINGNKIKTLIDEYKDSGNYTISWDGQDQKMNNVCSGLYIYKIISDRFIETRKMTLLR